ncbi:MAG: TlpA disulfide reductase family protein [Alphaproteobacteria bacterium]
MLSRISKAIALGAALFAVTVADMRSVSADESVRLDAERAKHLLGLARIDGRPLTPDQLRGRAVIVSFFASWCPPCNTEFEHLNLLNVAHAAKGLTIVAVNQFEDFTGFDDNGKRLNRFLDRHQPVFSIVKGTDETAKLFGDVKRIPTVFVFDRSGAARLHFIHAKDAKKTNPGMNELQNAVRNALGTGAADASLLI